MSKVGVNVPSSERGDVGTSEMSLFALSVSVKVSRLARDSSAEGVISP